MKKVILMTVASFFLASNASADATLWSKSNQKVIVTRGDGKKATLSPENNYILFQSREKLTVTRENGATAKCPLSVSDDLIAYTPKNPLLRAVTGVAVGSGIKCVSLGDYYETPEYKATEEGQQEEEQKAKQKAARAKRIKAQKNQRGWDEIAEGVRRAAFG